MMSCVLYGRLMLQMSRVNILSHRWWSWTMLWASDVVWCGAMLSLIVVRSGSQHWLLSGSSKLILDVTDSLHTPYRNFIINPKEFYLHSTFSTTVIPCPCHTWELSPYYHVATPMCHVLLPRLLLLSAAEVCTPPLPRHNWYPSLLVSDQSLIRWASVLD